MRRRILTVTAVSLGLLALLAGPARAHVDVEAEEAVAGAETTLTFSFQHGKDGTPTTGLEVLMPEGTEVLSVPEVEGWASEVDDVEGTVTWTGGPVADGDRASFPVEVRLPATPGVVLFKTIQTAEAGELAWIEEEDGHEEGSYPAPRLELVADPNATTTTENPTSTTAAGDDTTTTTERLPGTTLEADQRDDGNNSAAPWFIGSGIAALVAIGAGGYWLKSRAA